MKTGVEHEFVVGSTVTLKAHVSHPQEGLPMLLIIVAVHIDITAEGTSVGYYCRGIAPAPLGWKGSRQGVVQIARTLSGWMLFDASELRQWTPALDEECRQAMEGTT